MRKGSLLKVSLKVNTECIRFTSLAILIIALLPADIKGHCPLVHTGRSNSLLPLREEGRKQGLKTGKGNSSKLNETQGRKSAKQAANGPAYMPQSQEPLSRTHNNTISQDTDPFRSQERRGVQ